MYMKVVIFKLISGFTRTRHSLHCIQQVTHFTTPLYYLAIEIAIYIYTSIYTTIISWKNEHMQVSIDTFLCTGWENLFVEKVLTILGKYLP